ncbi:MAG: radical SAM protein, partial [Halobacteriaceae archaeon]
VKAAREGGLNELEESLKSIQGRKEWVRYSLEHLQWVQEIGNDLNIPIHLWPDSQLISNAPTQYTKWLKNWKDRPTPEKFGKSPSETPQTDNPPPSIPAD